MADLRLEFYDGRRNRVRRRDGDRKEPAAGGVAEGSRGVKGGYEDSVEEEEVGGGERRKGGDVGV